MKRFKSIVQIIALWFACILLFGSPMRKAETALSDEGFSHFKKDYSKAYLEFYRNRYKIIYNDHNIVQEKNRGKEFR